MAEAERKDDTNTLADQLAPYSPLAGRRVSLLPARPTSYFIYGPRVVGTGTRFDIGLALVCLALVIAAETITAYLSPVYGVLLHIAVLFALLTVHVFFEDPRHRAFLLAVSIAPLIRVLSLGIPLTHFAQPFWYILTAVPLFLATFMIVRELHLPRQALNLRLPRLRVVPIECLVVLSGVALGVLEWNILRERPIVQHPSALQAVGVVLILTICTGFMEELVFRGLIQRIAENVLGRHAGLLFMALLFAALHIGWRSPLDWLFVFCVALYFGMVVRVTKSLLGVSLAHGAINSVQFLALPLLFH